ncbi:MAG: hypothetical protein ACREN0_02590, partial [Thermodesulfobacteriota bacterium]
MRVVHRYLFIFLSLIIGVQASAEEDVRVDEMFDYAFSENAATGQKQEDGKDGEFVTGEEGEERLGVKAFLRDSAIMYGGLWASRFFYVRNKNSRIF